MCRWSGASFGTSGSVWFFVVSILVETMVVMVNERKLVSFKTCMINLECNTKSLK